MAIYRIGKIISMMRDALGITQEELVEIYDGSETEDEKERKKVLESYGKNIKNGKRYKDDKKNIICSTQVIRRIEKGTVNRVRMDIYHKIMIKIGALPERYYASILVTDYRAIAWEMAVHIHINRKEYDRAERILQRIEKVMVMDYPRNQQYLMERRATMAYRQRNLAPEEYIEILTKALKLTIPMFDQIDLAKWPLNENEIIILSGMANVYHFVKDREKELDLLLKLKKNIEEQYMDWAHYVIWHIGILERLSRFMSMIGKNDESINYCKIAVRECKEHNILGNVCNFLYDIVWNSEQNIVNKLLVQGNTFPHEEVQVTNERATRKRLLAQGYFLSLAQGSNFEAQRIKRLSEKCFPGEIKLL